MPVVGENAFNRAHPVFPIAPQDIAEAAYEAEQVGASAVHLHIRDTETGAGSRDPDLFLDMATRTRERGVNAIINITCGGIGKHELSAKATRNRATPARGWAASPLTQT